MPMSKKFLLLLSLVFLLFIGAGCVSLGVGKGSQGVFKSVDRGEHWQQKASLVSLKGGENITSVNVGRLVFDPQDSGALYLGTKENGLFLSIDAGDKWQKIERLPAGSVNAIAVHPKASHIVYVAVGNRIFRSSNCCRTWENIYLETKEETEVVEIVVHPISQNVIYAGLTDGRLIKSDNSGYGWSAVHKFDGRIRQILINPKNPNIFYVFHDGGGVFKSEDGGQSWLSLSANLKDFRGGNEINKAVFIPAFTDGLITANHYGLLLTQDGGRTWSAYKLLTSPGAAEIQTLAIDLFNSNVIYYISGATLYKTINGGANWMTKSIPSKQKVIDLIVDPINTNILYLTYQKEPKKYGF